MSVERLVIVGRGLFLQRTNISTTQVLFRLWLRSPLRWSLPFGKLFQMFENDVSPVPGKSPNVGTFVQHTVIWRTVAGGVWSPRGPPHVHRYRPMCR